MPPVRATSTSSVVPSSSDPPGGGERGDAGRGRGRGVEHGDPAALVELVSPVVRQQQAEGLVALDVGVVESTDRDGARIAVVVAPAQHAVRRRDDLVVGAVGGAVLGADDDDELAVRAVDTVDDDVARGALVEGEDVACEDASAGLGRGDVDDGDRARLIRVVVAVAREHQCEQLVGVDDGVGERPDGDGAIRRVAGRPAQCTADGWIDAVVGARGRVVVDGEGGVQSAVGAAAPFDDELEVLPFEDLRVRLDERGETGGRGAGRRRS